MPNRSKQKGDREERAIVQFFRDNGFECDRTLESGKRGEGDTWDINLTVGEVSLKGECKMRKDGFKTIYDYKGNADFLTLRANGKQRLYVIDEELFLKLINNS